jgi:hypothetical protein
VVRPVGEDCRVAVDIGREQRSFRGLTRSL